jgi:hypothetical protein
MDAGDVDIETLINDCWFVDARGVKRQFYRSRGGYGVGGTPIGGDRTKMPLPKTLHLQYYDYQFGRFYQLYVALPQQKLYDLFKQRTIDIDADDKPVVPRFNEVVIGIAPNGFIMLWASVDGGYDEVELMGPLTAINIDGLTVAMYNQSVRESFWLATDRFDYLSRNDGIKPETLAKLKTGWLPDSRYYELRRIK